MAHRGGRPLPPFPNPSAPVTISGGVSLLQALPWLLISFRALAGYPTVPTPNGQPTSLPLGMLGDPALTYLSGCSVPSLGKLCSPALALLILPVHVHPSDPKHSKLSGNPVAAALCHDRFRLQCTQPRLPRLPRLPRRTVWLSRSLWVYSRGTSQSPPFSVSSGEVV